MAESFSSVQQKMAAKQRKIAKLENKVKCAKEEIQDLHEEFQEERDRCLFLISHFKQSSKHRRTLLDFLPNACACSLRGTIRIQQERER